MDRKYFTLQETREMGLERLKDGDGTLTLINYSETEIDSLIDFLRPKYVVNAEINEHLKFVHFYTDTGLINDAIYFINEDVREDLQYSDCYNYIEPYINEAKKEVVSFIPTNRPVFQEDITKARQKFVRRMKKYNDEALAVAKDYFNRFYYTDF